MAFIKALRTNVWKYNRRIALRNSVCATSSVFSKLHRNSNIGRIYPERRIIRLRRIIQLA